jgi:hypothetical protein
VSCNYYGLRFLANVLVSGSLSHTVSQTWHSGTAGDHHYSASIFVCTTPNTLDAEHSILDISRMITGSTALLCINSALSLVLFSCFLTAFPSRALPLRIWSASLWGGQGYKGTEQWLDIGQLVDRRTYWWAARLANGFLRGCSRGCRRV